jgi:hypothetical protein
MAMLSESLNILSYYHVCKWYWNKIKSRQNSFIGVIENRKAIKTGQSRDKNTTRK